MGGREAIRGFSIQTFVVVLDALRDDNEWSEVQLEPDSANDKVDILWKYPSGRKRAQQVKSSKNQITKGDAVKWCAELAAEMAADEYQLILSGPVAKAVLDDQPFSSVTVPTPLSLDTIALMEQGCTKIDIYLEARGITRLPHSIREAIVNVVSARLTDGALRGRWFSRDEFHGWIVQLVTASYPEAIAHALTANCEILWNEVIFKAQGRLTDDAFRLDCPLSIINGGPGVAILDGLALKINGPGHEMRYLPSVFADGGGEKSFGAIAILPNSSKDVTAAFLPHSAIGFWSSRWQQGTHKFALWAKFRGAPEPRKVSEFEIDVALSHFQALIGKPVAQRLSPPTFD